MKTNKMKKKNNDDENNGCNAVVRPKCTGISKKNTHTARESERSESTITAHRMKCLIVIMQSRQFIESMLGHELSRRERASEEPTNRRAKEMNEREEKEERW